MNLKHRSYKKELLDRDDIPFEDIKRNMSEIKTINSLLGGFRISISGLHQLLQKKTTILICEIGCVSGDNLEALYNWCVQNNIEAKFIGIDIKKECIEAAQLNLKLASCTEWIISDYAVVQFSLKPDIIFSSLFCHHFTNEELSEQLKWMKEKCNIGFFINDLQRHWLAYYSIKFITKIFSASYLVKNDAPLSVSRGFLKNEWSCLLQSADLESAKIKWKWAFRYLIIWNK